MTETKKRAKGSHKDSTNAYERALCSECKVVLNRTGLWSDELYSELEQHIHDMFNGEGEVKLFLNLDSGTIERAREKLRTRPDLRYVINELGGISEEVVLWVLGR